MLTTPLPLAKLTITFAKSIKSVQQFSTRKHLDCKCVWWKLMNNQKSYRKGNPNFMWTIIEYIYACDACKLSLSGGLNRIGPRIWEPSTHGGRHNAFLLRKTRVDAGQMWCSVVTSSAWWSITPSQKLPVASFTKEVNPRLAKCPLVNFLSKRGHCVNSCWKQAN